MNRRREMAISEAELRALTADMVEMHHATFPQMRARLAELGASLRPRLPARTFRADRRRLVLGGSGLVLGSMFLGACGDDDDVETPAGVGDEPDDQPTPAVSEVEALKLNASIENLAVFAYTSALDAAPKGKFGENFPDAVAGFAQHAMAQHKEHAEAFNAALKNAGGQPYTDPTPGLVPTITQMFEDTDSVTGLARLALTLENTAAATYTKQMEQLASEEALGAVATIAPVERQHAAILHYVLGEYPVPATFVPLEKGEDSLGALEPDALRLPAGSTATPTAGATRIVIENFKFVPDALTVTAGAKITVENRDQIPHTITARDGAFDSGNMAGGQTYEFSVKEPGEYPYFCEIHEYMTGRITVTPRS